MRAVQLLLLRLSLGVAAATLAVESSADSVRESRLQQPMQFELLRPCSGNGSVCAEYILAQGVITDESPKRLQMLLGTISWQPEVYFDSPGGDVAAALEVGHMIRARMLTTRVGGGYADMVDRDDHFSDSRIVVAEAECFSACVYAFLGGSTRILEEPGKLGVHQFAGVSADLGESVTQAGVAVLSRYVESMGVDRVLLDIAASAPPNGIRLVPLTTAYALNVDNTHPPVARWNLAANDDGQLRLEATQRHTQRDATTTLVFGDSDGISTKGAIVYSVHQVFRSPEEVLEILRDVNSVLQLGSGRVVAIFSPSSSWRQVRDGTYVRSFSVPHRALLSVAALPQATFEIDFPNCCRDVSPTVTFGTEGLLPGLRALARH